METDHSKLLNELFVISEQLAATQEKLDAVITKLLPPLTPPSEGETDAE